VEKSPVGCDPLHTCLADRFLWRKFFFSNHNIESSHHDGGQHESHISINHRRLTAFSGADDLSIAD